MSREVQNDPEKMLRESAVPGSLSDAAWDERAEAIVQRAMKAERAADLETVLAPVSLAAEPGEPTSSTSSSAVSIVGVSKMSESENPKGSSSGPMSSRSAGPTSMRSGRPSLKELAERVSKTPPPASVAPPPSSLSAVATPPPAAPSSLGALAQQVASKPPPSTATPLPAAPASTATPLPAPSVKAGSASTESAPPPSAAAPASTAAPASQLAPVVPITAAKEEKKSGSYGGIIIALVGVAAAAAIFVFLKVDPFKAKAPEPEKQAAKVEEPAPAPEEPTAKVEEPVAAAPEPEQDDAVDIDKLTEPTAEPTAPPQHGGPLPPSSAVAANDPAKDTKPDKVNPDGTLDEDLNNRYGGEKKEATPASDDEARPSNVPSRPPTGKVTAAVGSVMGGAKACVAGADDVSRANITFGSSGAVKSVSVSGWAAGKPAASCIQSALKGANVGPFSDPTFVFGVTIRP
jgi:hypothetical protein